MHPLLLVPMVAMATAMETGSSLRAATAESDPEMVSPAGNPVPLAMLLLVVAAVMVPLAVEVEVGMVEAAMVAMANGRTPLALAPAALHPRHGRRGRRVLVERRLSLVVCLEPLHRRRLPRSCLRRLAGQSRQACIPPERRRCLRHGWRGWRFLVPCCDESWVLLRMTVKCV